MKNNNVQEAIYALEAVQRIATFSSDKETKQQMEFFNNLVSIVIEYAQKKLDEDNIKDVFNKVDNIFKDGIQ